MREREMAMNKTTRTVGVKRVKLTLGKETVAILTPDMLRNVAGGSPPITLRSECFTRCMDGC
jgi:hypothetical protein